jgi:hypothetical protein
MTDVTNPAAALRSAMRDLFAMFKETLGDEAGAAALKTAVERALSDVTGRGSRRAAPPPKATPKPTARTPAPQLPQAPKSGKRKGGKKKAAPALLTPGRQRQIDAMKEWWRKKKAEAGAQEKPARGATV